MIIAYRTKKGAVIRADYSDEECRRFLSNSQAYKLLKAWYLSGEKVTEIQPKLQSVFQNKDNVRSFMVTLEQKELMLDTMMSEEEIYELDFERALAYADWLNMDKAKAVIKTINVNQILALFKEHGSVYVDKTNPDLSQKVAAFVEMVDKETMKHPSTEVNTIGMLNVEGFFRNLEERSTLYLETTLFDEDA